jgi:chlorite dismutase
MDFFALVNESDTWRALELVSSSYVNLSLVNESKWVLEHQCRQAYIWLEGFMQLRKQKSHALLYLHVEQYFCIYKCIKGDLWFHLTENIV